MIVCMSLCASVGHETALLMQTLTQDHEVQNTNEAEIRGNKNDYNQSVSQSINQAVSQPVNNKFAKVQHNEQNKTNDEGTAVSEWLS